MPTRIHLVPVGFYPDAGEQCHFVSYAAPDGFWGGLANQGERLEIPDEELVGFANAVNRDFCLRTMANGRVTMLPLALVMCENQDSSLPPVPIIESMLELWARRMGSKMPSTVVFVISNMWNPDITALHQRWEAQGYNLRGVKDLYVWTM